MRPKIIGKKVLGLSSTWPRALLNHTPRGATRLLKGRRIVRADRRGKYFLVEAEGGIWVVGHLRMSGNLHWAEKRRPGPHVRHRLIFEDGGQLWFSDARKFGRIWIGRAPEQFLAHLGPEPLDPAWTSRCLHASLRRRHRRLKPLLLDQGFLAGLGNIYTDESLHRSQLNPLRLADSLDGVEARRLHRSIRHTLRMALNRGGTSFDQALLNEDGSPQGSYQSRLRAYGRAGLPCVRCGTELARSVIAQRGTTFCPVCQPVPAG